SGGRSVIGSQVRTIEFVLSDQEPKPIYFLEVCFSVVPLKRDSGAIPTFPGTCPHSRCSLRGSDTSLANITGTSSCTLISSGDSYRRACNCVSSANCARVARSHLDPC